MESEILFACEEIILQQSDEDTTSSKEDQTVDLLELNIENTNSNKFPLNTGTSSNSFESDREGNLGKKDINDNKTPLNTGTSNNSFESDSEENLDKNMTIYSKPLACLMPTKYKDTDVKLLFPDFCDGKVLRFSRLFGPGKQSSLPNIWRTISRKKKRALQASEKTKVEPKSPPPLQYESDEEVKFSRWGKISQSENHSKGPNDEQRTLNNQWRFGPAKLWYDMLELPETAETFDYGFQLKESDSVEDVYETSDPVPDEAFLMVSQHSWEDDVIWDGEEIRQKIIDNLNNPAKPAGWIPSGLDRTVAAFHERAKTGVSKKPETFVSVFQEFSKFNNVYDVSRTKEIRNLLKRPMFPAENEKLLYKRWEDDVIWDSEAMDSIPSPKTFVVDDDDIILDIPDDTPPKEDNNIMQSKDSKGQRLQEEKLDEDSGDDTSPQKQDPFNISNDEYYNPKMTQDAALKPNIGGSLVQHSIPALELRTPLFPTYMGPQKLRNFHRPTLKQYSHGALASVGMHTVHYLHKHIRNKQKQRQQECEATGGGEMFFMRTPSDLTAKDGELVLFEYSEEHPPLMMQVGMAAKIRNYYKRKPGKDTSNVSFKYGEFAYAHTSPFLGKLEPGQCLQAFENNLFRSPIFEHNVNNTDFVIIRTRHKYYVRDAETVYSVGQQLPLMEVPAPKSEKANNFMRDFLMVFIYRLFAKSNDDPRRIKMEDIKKAFPMHREFSIRKRLKLCADFQRTGIDSKSWFQRAHFRLPSEDEIREMVSPEQCCAYYSMVAAEQRLKDAGYGEKFFLSAEDENADHQTKIDDEVKTAPWNTTQAFISAMKGKSYMQLSGVADPTGCGEGFSYVKVPNKPQWLKEEFSCNLPLKRVVKGTDADLRRLSLTNAKKLLREFKVPDHEIKKLSRWQVIDVVRTLSTQQARSGEEGVTKFARGNKFSLVEHQKKYKEECQRLFDLQNKVLASNESLSTDEDSSSEEDSDLEEMGKHIENILSNKKTAQQLSLECEEAERKELQKMMLNNDNESAQAKDKGDKTVNAELEGKIMKIYRTYQNVDGTEYVRVETVRKPTVIELYSKIRETKNIEFIRNYAIDKDIKEEMRRERRRIQDQLRRLKKNEEKDRMKEPPRKKHKIEPVSLSKLKCGACGATGHMRTNKACPFYQQSSPSLPPVQVAMTVEQEEAEEKEGLEDDNLVKVDETKLILSKQLVKHADELRRKSLLLKFPKEAMFKKKRKGEDSVFEYAKVPKFVNRKRTDPVVSIGIVFENILNEMKNLPHTQPFWLPVSSKLAPGYYTFITKPMDLQTMREKIHQHQYKSREHFLNDANQIVENSNLYNGNHSFLSLTAREMLEHCIKRFSEEEERLMHLEKAINPLLDNERVAFCFILESIVTEQLKTVRESWPFHKPVDKKIAKGYYEIVKQPMDLDSIIKNCKAHKYTSRDAFLSDVQLLYTNSVLYNGASNHLSEVAKEILDTCLKSLEIYDTELVKYESSLAESAEAQEPNDASALFTPPKRKRIPKIIFNRADVILSPLSEHLDSEEEDSFVDVECNDQLNGKNFHEEDREETSDSCAGDSDLEQVPQQVLDPMQQLIDTTQVLDAAQPSSTVSSPSGSPVTIENHLQQEYGGGVVQAGSSDDFANGPLPNIECDNICDDLMLSDSDPEKAPLSDEDSKEFWF